MKKKSKSRSPKRKNLAFNGISTSGGAEESQLLGDLVIEGIKTRIKKAMENDVKPTTFPTRVFDKFKIVKYSDQEAVDGKLPIKFVGSKTRKYLVAIDPSVSEHEFSKLALAFSSQD